MCAYVCVRFMVCVCLCLVDVCVFIWAGFFYLLCGCVYVCVCDYLPLICKYLFVQLRAVLCMCLCAMNSYKSMCVCIVCVCGGGRECVCQKYKLCTTNLAPIQLISKERRVLIKGVTLLM